MVVVIGTEKRGKAEVEQVISKLKTKYGKLLPRIMHFIHPQGLPGEIVGVASPNRTWAAKHAVEALKSEGEIIQNYVFTTFDSDTILHPEFLSRLSYLYLTDEKRFNRFYETCVRLFDNNFWEVPIMSRIEASNVTFGVLARKQNEAFPEE